MHSAGLALSGASVDLKFGSYTNIELVQVIQRDGWLDSGWFEFCCHGSLWFGYGLKRDFRCFDPQFAKIRHKAATVHASMPRPDGLCVARHLFVPDALSARTSVEADDPAVSGVEHRIHKGWKRVARRTARARRLIVWFGEVAFFLDHCSVHPHRLLMTRPRGRPVLVTSRAKTPVIQWKG